MTSKQSALHFSCASDRLLTAFVSVAAEPETPHKKFFVPPPPFSPGIFPCSQCHSGMPVNKQTAQTRHASEHRAEPYARRLVLRLPQSGQSRHAASRERQARSASRNRTISAASATERSCANGRQDCTERGRAVERRETVPALRPLPLAARPAVQADQAAAAAGKTDRYQVGTASLLGDQKIEKNREGVHLDRRTFLKGAALGVAGTALPLNKADASFWESFFQKHFQEMNDAEIKQVLQRA